MSDTHSDALTELVRSLREQLARREERIRNLETLLQEANRRVTEQQKLLTRLLDERSRASAASPAQTAAAFATAPGPAPSPATAVVDRSTPTSSSTLAPAPRAVPRAAARPLPSSEPPPERVKLPDLGPQIQVIATAVVAARARQQESERPVTDRDDGFEITARLDRGRLKRGHRALASKASAGSERPKRRLWPWGGRRSEP